MAGVTTSHRGNQPLDILISVDPPFLDCNATLERGSSSAISQSITPDKLIAFHLESWDQLTLPAGCWDP
jgi:hypothetical protein